MAQELGDVLHPLLKPFRTWKDRRISANFQLRPRALQRIMKIKSKLWITTIFSICAALAGGSALFLISKDVNEAIERNETANEVAGGANQ